LFGRTFIFVDWTSDNSSWPAYYHYIVSAQTKTICYYTSLGRKRVMHHTNVLHANARHHLPLHYPPQLKLWWLLAETVSLHRHAISWIVAVGRVHNLNLLTPTSRCLGTIHKSYTFIYLTLKIRTTEIQS
jgi:hypothetical protein